MPSPHSILVALDFSPYSNAGVEQAFALAAKLEASVHLLHVYTLQGKHEPAPFSSAELDEARSTEKARLDAIVNAHRPSGRLGEVLWREGDPASLVVSTSEEYGVGLIVIGASGRTGMSRLVLGSVAESVVKNARCNVLVVRRAELAFADPGPRRS